VLDEPRGPVLVAASVVLRPLDRAGAGRVLAGAPAPDERWAEGFPTDGTRTAARATLAAADAGVPFGAFGAYLVVRRADGTCVGDVGFHGPPDPRGRVEVGFALVPSARGAGLATEALCCLIAWAVAQPVVDAVVARTAPENRASRAVLARAGFVPAGRAGTLLRHRLAAPPHVAH
jgi:RimJ/RimL family protein N-acetyltransferase